MEVFLLRIKDLKLSKQKELRKGFSLLSIEKPASIIWRQNSELLEGVCPLIDKDGKPIITKD